MVCNCILSINCLFAFIRLKELKATIDQTSYDKAEYVIVYNLIALNVLVKNGSETKKYLNIIKSNSLTNSQFKTKNRQLAYFYLKLGSIEFNSNDYKERLESIKNAYDFFTQSIIKDEDKQYLCLISVILATNANQNRDPKSEQYAKTASEYVESLSDRLVKGKQKLLFK